ncbi:hypothetical protein K1719_045850 [Acacia pycnantha]|nr:hypothetical protein K1719_045850 [Acacia pycnantha]
MEFPRFNKNFLSKKGAGRSGILTQATTESILSFFGLNSELMGLYYCPKLQSLSPAELSSKKLMEIIGESEWWEALQWSEAEWGQPDPCHKFNKIFYPIAEKRGILAQLTTYELPSFNREIDSGDILLSSLWH